MQLYILKIIDQILLNTPGVKIDKYERVYTAASLLQIHTFAHRAIHTSVCFTMKQEGILDKCLPSSTQLFGLPVQFHYRRLQSKAKCIS